MCRYFAQLKRDRRDKPCAGLGLSEKEQAARQHRISVQLFLETLSFQKIQAARRHNTLCLSFLERQTSHHRFDPREVLAEEDVVWKCGEEEENREGLRGLIYV